ncbi:hypothetical protein EG867_16000, partial [Enterococcus faecalis]
MRRRRRRRGVPAPGPRAAARGPLPDPAPGQQILDNWDLSVKRATTVVRVLTQDTHINPKRLVAS